MLPPIHSGENIGYGAAGASKTRRALKGMTAKSFSAHEDIDIHNKTMRQRGRLLYMSAPIATSAINTNRTNVVGCGLNLKCRINRTALGMSREEADAWERRTEAEFALWATRKQNCDATGVNDFYGMQQLALVSWLVSGDSITLVKRQEPTPMQPYSLRLHIIEADCVSTPPNAVLPFDFTGRTVEGRTIFDGVEIGRGGGIEAYHVCNMYPHQAPFWPDKAKWTRVTAHGAETGLPNVLHLMSSERPEQYRGVSYLAPVIEAILQIRRYTESELTAALVNSFFTVFVKYNTPANFDPMNETKPQDQVSHDPNEYEMGPGNINFLEPDESIELAESKHPNNGFDGFVRALSSQVGAALEVPADLLLKAFTSSYSASRAALLEAWKAFRMRRTWFASDFCAPVYELFLSEAIALGRVTAPGFFADPLLRDAWLGSEWIGPSQGQIDPVKEIRAHTKAIDYGLETHEQATVALTGGNWDSNIEQLAIENARKAAAFASIAASTEIDPEPPEDEDDDNDDDTEEEMDSL
jgi:lambda family phage portal protein